MMAKTILRRGMMASRIMSKVKRIFVRDKRKQDNYTSIEDIFQFELLMVKLFAGFMFSGNKYICFLYRAVVMIWAKYSQASFQMSFRDSLHTSLSESVLTNLRFFIFFYLAANILASITTLMSSLTFYKSLWMPLHKRFNRAYLEGTRVAAIDVGNMDDGHDEGPYYKSPLSAASTASLTGAASSSGAESGVSNFSNQCVTSISGSFVLSEMNQGDSSKSPTMASSIASSRKAHVALARTKELIDGISKVTLIKTFLVCYILFGATTSFIVNEYSKLNGCGTNRAQVYNETTATELSAMTQILNSIIHKRDVNQRDSPPLISSNKTLESATQDTNVTTTTTTASRPANSNRSYATRRLARPADCYRAHNRLHMPKLTTYMTFYYLLKILRHILNSLANFYQIYGHVVVTLFITTALTEMLRRANEQEGSVTAFQGLETYKQSDNRINRERSVPHETLLPTTDMLIHARDILWVLKSSLSFDYVAIQCQNVSQLIVLSSSILALVSAKSKLGWLIIFSVEYIQINLGMIFIRITYHWLHSEARKTRHLSEQRVMACNIMLDRSELDFDIREPQSCDQNHRQYPPAVHTSVARIKYCKQVAIMNYRLADQIEELWPCEWFTPDLKSCLALNLFVITFVATVQQMVEANNSKGISRIFE